MVIVNGKNISEVSESVRDSTVYVFPVPTDSFVHPHQTSISLLFVLTEDGVRYCVPFNHPDVVRQGLSLADVKRIIVLNKKDFLHLYGVTDIRPSQVIDLSTMLYLEGEQIPDPRSFFPPFIQRQHQLFKFKKLNLTVPVAIWCECADNVFDWMVGVHEKVSPREFGDAFTFINDTTIPTLWEIESAGLHTVDGTTEFSNYNIYTSTGRPSNAFGGVNYAALNKHDGTRDRYVSRFGSEGTLVQFDYEAFHVRLMAKVLGYDLPTTSVHRFLAQTYYGTLDITPEQYEESKARTFAIMYGRTEDTGNVEFFTRMRSHIQSFTGDRFTSHTGRTVVVHDPSPEKLFNYSMQLLETETALSRVQRALSFLRKTRSLVVLYTYDAILLDVHNDDLIHMDAVQEILELGGFPTRQYRGQNYGNLQEFSTS